MLHLRGLAWDHQRCWGPLDGSVAPYTAMHTGMRISWDRQSLYEFGEGNLAAALRQYDLVVFDHPFVGEIARSQLTLAFDAHLSSSEKARFEADAVGASWRSYQAEGKQWALPIDAAAQVSAYRPDLLQAHTAEPPTSHEEVLALGRTLRKSGQWLGLPWVPTDAMCLVLSLAAAGQDAIGEGECFLSLSALERIVGQLRELAALAHPESSAWNPIRCYEHMVKHDDVVYVPYAFGYVNYAAREMGPCLRFGNIPAPQARGALLGGAGIGVSAASAHPTEAIAYAKYLCSADFQRGPCVRFGGQPASRSAWLDPQVNQLTRGFFQDTLQTLSQAYLRPTRPGFIQFFRASTHEAAQAITGTLSVREFAQRLDQRYARIGLAHAGLSA